MLGKFEMEYTPQKLTCMDLYDGLLVGGFNPFEKY